MQNVEFDYNIIAEFIIMILHFIALYIVFGRLHRPQSQLKKIISYAIMLLNYPVIIACWWVANDSILGNIVMFLTFLSLALLCRREGDRMRPIISAFYVCAMVMMIAIIVTSYAVVFVGLAPFLDLFSLESYVVEFVNSAIYIAWAAFYYRVSRNMSANTPLSFLLLIMFMPLAVVGMSLFVNGDINKQVWDESWRLAALQSDLFLYGGLFCTLILIFNMCAFYLYTKLAVAYEALRFAQNLANTPPVWTAEAGLSTLFIEKYQITPRERQVIEILLLGKTDKEIANELDLAVNTIQAHLKRVYKKTGAAGRFALAALVRGE